MDYGFASDVVNSIFVLGSIILRGLGGAFDAIDGGATGVFDIIISTLGDIFDLGLF